MSNSHVLLVTGGNRSGKSCFAEQRAEVLPGERLYIATCSFVDDEMAQRIAAHRRRREGKGWRSMEAPLAPAEAVRHSGHPVMLIDCLALWVNNLLFESERQGSLLDEQQMAAACEQLIQALRSAKRKAILVTSEVGLGIVPADPLSRRYRDLLGRCNQIMAADADEVVLVVCGLPITLKG